MKSRSAIPEGFAVLQEILPSAYETKMFNGLDQNTPWGKNPIYFTRANQTADGRSQQEYEAVEIAIQTLNEGLTRLHGEFPWSAEKAAENGLLSRLTELNKVFSERN